MRTDTRLPVAVALALALGAVVGCKDEAADEPQPQPPAPAEDAAKPQPKPQPAATQSAAPLPAPAWETRMEANPHYARSLADVHYRYGSPDEGARLYKIAIAAAKSPAEVRSAQVAFAQACVAAGKSQQAIDAYNAGLQAAVEPNARADILTRLARELRRAKRYAEAEPYAREAVALAGDAKNAATAEDVLVSIHRYLGTLDKLVAEFEAKHKADPSNVAALALYGKACAELPACYDRAIDALEALTRFRPKDVRLYLLIGKVCQLANAPERLEAIYPTLLDLMPVDDRPMVYERIARAFFDAGKPEKGEEWLAKMVAGEHKYPFAYVYAAHLLMDQGDWSRAAEFFTKAQPVAQDAFEREQYTLQTGHCLTKAHKFDEAEKVLKDRVENSPNKQIQRSAQKLLDELEAERKRPALHAPPELKPGFGPYKPEKGVKPDLTPK